MGGGGGLHCVGLDNCVCGGEGDAFVVLVWIMGGGRDTFVMFDTPTVRVCHVAKNWF